MLLVKTPFRVSLFGGGTDVPAFFRKESGQVLGFAIKKYAYVTIKQLPPFYDHKIRLSYSKIERCKCFEDIQHPLIKAALNDFKVENIEIHHDSDLPGKSGIASSSSFAVALAHGLLSYKGKPITKSSVAEKAIYWERYLLKEKGGLQDQLFAAYGGFNHIRFNLDGSYKFEKLELSDQFRSDLQQQSILCYLPIERFSYLTSVANHLNDTETIKNLIAIKKSVKKGLEIIKSSDVNALGELLDKYWRIKRLLPNVTNKIIDEIYDKAINNGALGGKLLGAGKGGFMLFICKKNSLDNLRESLSPLITIPLEIENKGSQIIYSNN